MLDQAGGRPIWEQHMKSPHLTEFSAATEGMVEQWELFLGEKIDA
jgi:quinol monooxygenase YgiN